MGTSSKSIHRALEEVAELQGGCFTAKQAVAVGYADSVHNYHVNNGDWIKEIRGVYRLAELPKPDWPELVIWSLWSRGREDTPQAIYCMQTALAIHGLIAKEDDIMHMAVPTSFRRNSEIPQQLKLYKEDIPAHEVEKRPGFLVTTLERTVRDIRGKCTNPKILQVLEAALVSKKTPEPELEPVDDRNTRAIPAFKVADYSDWDYWDRPVTATGPAVVGSSYNDIINAGED
jgi:hypothetical protein